MQSRISIILSGLVGIHILFLVYLRFTAWPEMLSYPYLLNNGFNLYKDFVHPYPPLLTSVLALVYSAFGYNLLTLKLFTWSLILLNDILIFKLVKKLGGKDRFALMALAIYVFTQPMLEGNQLWFDLAIVTPILFGTYFLTNEKTNKNIIMSGIFFGLAALIKQTSGLFLVAGLTYLTLTKNTKRILPFLLGPLVLGTITLIYLVQNGLLLDFINWNLIYPFTFWSKFPGYIQMNVTNGQMFILGTLLFPLFVLLAQNYKHVMKDKVYTVLGIFLLISFVMIYPRFSFFHFQLALAFIVISLGYLMSKFRLSPLVITMTSMFIFFAITLMGIKKEWGLEPRFWGNEETAFAERINRQIGENGVYILGEPSSLYVFSNSLPPKPWLDNYGWYFEVKAVQANTITRWKENPPKFIIWRDPHVGDWYDLGVYQPKEITNWIKDNFFKKEEIKKGVWLWQKRD